jgi:hypothetical protein
MLEDPNNGGSPFVRNIGKFLTNYMTSHDKATSFRGKVVPVLDQEQRHEEVRERGGTAPNILHLVT